MKIAVKVVTDASQASGGLADARMLKPFASEVFRYPDEISVVSGGVLPITAAEFALIRDVVTTNLELENGFNFQLEDGDFLLLEA
jgi:hypothetical protein